MKLDVRYANHPEDSKHYTTEELRKHYFIETIFVADDANLTYSHVDRIIAVGFSTDDAVVQKVCTLYRPFGILEDK